MKRIGIFLGSFDPIHNGHLTIATQVKKELDEILLVPLYDAPHKKALSEGKHRIKMCTMATELLTDIHVYDGIIVNKISGYSLSLIDSIKRDYPDADLFYIIGSDVFKHILSWETEKELSSRVKYIVIIRDEDDRETCEIISHKLSTDVTIKSLDLPCISSSEIKAARDFTCLNSKVIKYIEKHQLY